MNMQSVIHQIKIKPVLTIILCLVVSMLYAQEKDTYIKAGAMFDSQQKVFVQNQLIHIRGNKIVSVETFKEVPENVNFIDLSNYTILPGLIDAHTHVLFSQDANTDSSEHIIQTVTMESDALRALRGAKRARSYLDVGITTIKDLGNSGLFLDVALRDAINEGTIEGPRILASGPIMGAAGGQIYGVSPNHQNLIDLEYRVIKGVEDARNAVREHVNQGVDLIKICADNLPNKTMLTREEMEAIVQMAHDYGLSVTAHSVSDKSAWNAVHAGVDGIEHGFNIADSTLKLMAKKNVFLVPTENSRNYMNIYSNLAGFKKGETEWIDFYLEKMSKRLKQAIKLGVPIIAGSDNYTDIGGTRGKSSQDMLRAYFEAGMEPLSILQSATYLSARYVGMENDIGVIKSEAKADIIAVQGDVNSDFVKTMENVVFVMKDGIIYHQKTN
ncbi:MULTISPECIES: metal-dependent hydrolase family protein [Bizionia]|uniref:Amidohydrolase family protein n=1 Tax=Bizionia algoritergicola TaxID=291187 RepID=A0A5D0QZH8_9FLAO|nr:MULTISPECIES: amidohydrolase family protein [Bizionia]OBX22430.1 amidohydrolase [Bizionia sp. APA-3]TYB74673.1 amidohydrolase family protein [Bizionia algoritergicola]